MLPANTRPMNTTSSHRGRSLPVLRSAASITPNLEPQSQSINGIDVRTRGTFAPSLLHLPAERAPSGGFSCCLNPATSLPHSHAVRGVLGLTCLLIGVCAAVLTYWTLGLTLIPQDSGAP